MILVTVCERAILLYLAGVAEAGDTGPVSLRGMFADDKADTPREDFGKDDWGRWAELYFAVISLITMGLISGIAADGGGYPNRFQITDAGRAVLAADTKGGEPDGLE